MRHSSWLLAFFLLLTSLSARAQKNILKLPPGMEAKASAWLADSIRPSRFILQAEGPVPPAGFRLKEVRQGIYIAEGTPKEVLQWARSIPSAVYLDEQVRPVTEAGVLRYDMTLNGITAAWNRFPSLNGGGEVLAIQENKPDSLDPDLLGKSRPSGISSPVFDNHATIMATLATGTGNSSFRGKGVAYRAAYVSTDFIDVLPASASFYRNAGVQVQNHSYGTGIQNYYGVNARAFDLSANADSSLLHVFSAGNSGTSTSGAGAYAGIQRWANITGNMKMAKNLLLAGAVTEDGSVPSFSSRGPLHDGRIGPHLMALGEDGTSGAAAILSGTALLLQQQYKRLRGVPASSWLLRAILLNSAKDMGAPGPDHVTGFGLMDAASAMASMAEGRFINGVITASSPPVSYSLSVPAGSRLLKVTLAWNDVAAPAGAAKALVNDIDLVLVNSSTGERYLPWVLSRFPHPDSLSRPATRGRDTLNNMEQVSVLLPAAGNYVISVSVGKLEQPSLPYSIAYEVQADNVFNWTFPLQGDPLVAGEPVRLRWASTLPDARATIEMSADKGLSWRSLGREAVPDSGAFTLTLPDSLLNLRFRLSVPGRRFETADVLASPSVPVRFGFVCDTSLLTYWGRIRGAAQYELFRIDGDTLRSEGRLSDTARIALSKGSPYFSVAGVLDGRTALRGVLVDHRNQNIGCYISHFLASPRQGKADLVLNLGTLFQVSSVEIYKLMRNNKSLLKIDQPRFRDFTVTDTALQQGLNVYQAKVTLVNGQILYTSREVVYELAGKSHILFPNPAYRGSDIYLLSEDADDQDADLFDGQGRQLGRFLIREKQQRLPLDRLPAGMYALRISKAGKTLQVIRFIIQG